jgi:outer membrane protein
VTEDAMTPPSRIERALAAVERIGNRLPDPAVLFIALLIIYIPFLATQLDAQERLVERNTRDAYQGVVTGAARVKAFRQAVVSSRTALDASETGLEVGTRTAVDVLNAQQQLYAAERDYLQSRYDYLLSVLRLKAAAGRLTAVDLQEIDALLVEA